MNTSARRRFLGASAAALLAAWRPRGALAQAEKTKPTRLILLGTEGGPARVKGGRKSPAQVILVNDVPYVVDCGYEVAAQLMAAGVALSRLRYIFITHHHSDHNAEYGNLFFLAWFSGLRSQVHAYAPPPLAEMTRAFWEVNKYDVELRMKDQGMPDPRPNLVPHEVAQEGVIHEDANVKVTAARVHHPPTDAWAYRFDAKDRSIVISGDTSYSENLIRLANGADVLVHEVMNPGLIERNLASNPNREKLFARIKAVHTTSEEVGRIAQAAGVKKVVLSHLLNARPDDGVSDEQWAEGVRKNFSGEVVVGRDLMEI